MWCNRRGVSFPLSSLDLFSGLTQLSFDLELPLEVDDDYWETGNNCTDPFKQPPGVPSLIAAFNQFIKLTQVMAFTMRTLVTYFCWCSIFQKLTIFLFL